MIRVYHAVPTPGQTRSALFYGSGKICTVDTIRELWNKGKYLHVADVDVLDLHGAFALTRTAVLPWWNRPGVSPKKKVAEFRDTAVGDILQIENDYFVVARTGFDRITLQI